MKLLTKEDIAKQKSTERKSEIDEGLKLARKVDVLRETASKEESNLARFRAETLDRVKADILVLTKEKKLLIEEIESLKVTKDDIKRSSELEWQKVGEAKEDIGEKESDIARKALELEGIKSKLTSKSKELELRETHIANKEAKVAKMVSESDTNLQNAKASLERTRSKKTEIEAEIHQKSNDLLLREAYISARERELKLEREAIEYEKSGIINKNILLQDRERTLERELQRQRNNDIMHL